MNLLLNCDQNRSVSLHYFLTVFVPDRISRSGLFQPGHDRADPRVQSRITRVPTTLSKAHNPNLKIICLKYFSFHLNVSGLKSFSPACAFPPPQQMQVPLSPPDMHPPLSKVVIQKINPFFCMPIPWKVSPVSQKQLIPISNYGHYDL